MVKLTFHKGGRPVRAGLVCNIHWEPSSALPESQQTSFQTDEEGTIYINDSAIRNDGASTQWIAIGNPEGAGSLLYTHVTLRRDEAYEFHLELADPA